MDRSTDESPLGQADSGPVERFFFVHDQNVWGCIMSSYENNNLTSPDWVEGDGYVPRHSWDGDPGPAQVWLGLTGMCRHCGELIEIVDLADEGPGVYPVGTFDWRHGNGYFSCNRDGSWPMAEPSL